MKLRLLWERPEDWTGKKLPKSAVADNRRPAYGLGRILISVFIVFSLVAGFTAFAGVVRHPFVWEYWVNSLAALGYGGAAVSMAHNGKRMRIVGWACLIFECLGVLITTVGGYFMHATAPYISMWANFGSWYYYVPVFLPLVGMVWLYHSSPARIAMQ